MGLSVFGQIKEYQSRGTVSMKPNKIGMFHLGLSLLTVYCVFGGRKGGDMWSSSLSTLRAWWFWNWSFSFMEGSHFTGPRSRYSMCSWPFSKNQLNSQTLTFTLEDTTKSRGVGGWDPRNWRHTWPLKQRSHCTSIHSPTKLTGLYINSDSTFYLGTL